MDEQKEKTVETPVEEAEVVAEEPQKEEKPKAPKKKKKNEWEEKYNAEHDQYLRLYAEYDNYRKRTAREKDRMVADGLVKGISAILPTIDNLERAVLAAGEEESGLKSGVELTLKQLLEQLAKIGVTPIGAVGETFDPNFHEVIAHIDDDAYGADEIVEVFQRGYVYKEETVIRPAIVKTAN